VEPRHSRARHRSGSGRPAHARRGTGDLTAADLRRLRALLAAEDGADTEVMRPIRDELPNGHAAAGSTVGRVLVVARRGLAAGLSLAVLAGTGYGWSSLNHLQRSLNTTNVIAAQPPGEPGDGATDILLVGSDSRTDANGNPLPLSVLKLLRTEESAGLNTDTIILIRVPDDGGKAYAVSIPRDTYVPIPGYREDKINAAYGVSKRIAGNELRAKGVADEPRIDRESAQAGQRALVETVQGLTGVHVDHYAEINLYGFYLLTEALGGVEVCLKRSTSDPDSGANFRKGRQVVSGGDALAFVRQRKGLPRGDLDRIVRQQVFMAALVNKMLGAGSLADPGRLSGLVDAAQKSIVLDRGWDVLAFAEQLRGLAGGDVEFVTIPVVEVGARNERGQDIITVDQATVHAFFTGLLQGRTAAPDTPAPPTTAAADPASIIVSVRNGTNHGGLASRVTDILAGSGFRTGQTDNGGRRERTEVLVAPGARAAGERIAAALGGLPVVEDPSISADRARVWLGADYTGPGLQGFAAGSRLLRLDPALAEQPTDDAPITADGITCVN
jgi:LCP family protein required for cell wall assembly